MVKVDDAAGIEVLHHEKVAVVGPILDLDLTLRRFLHSIHEHTPEVLALSRQNCLMAIDWLLLYEEHHIGKSRVVDYGPHIPNERVDSLIIDFIFLEFPDV